VVEEEEEKKEKIMMMMVIIKMNNCNIPWGEDQEWSNKLAVILDRVHMFGVCVCVYESTNWRVGYLTESPIRRFI
jgi:hypothetical protein